MLSKILARDGAQVSATTAEREAADPLLRIAAAADMYHDALGTAAETHLGATRLDKLATLADTLYPRLTHAKAGPCCATTWPCWPAQDTTPPRPYRRP